MRCEVYKCRNNDYGYCMCDSYVTIESDGTCSEIHLDVESNDEDVTSNGRLE